MINILVDNLIKNAQFLPLMIALLTDFGQSEYVGIMKGVILQKAPHAQIIDLYHGVEPQHVRQAAWLLLQNYRRFPEGTIFLAVVDPGVGSERQAVAVKTSHYTFIGPDNGLLHPACHDDGLLETVALPTAGASATFHGRDVFAPAAGMLDAGAAFPSLGRATELREAISFVWDGREGEVVHIDHFGNIITTLLSLGKQAYLVNGQEMPFYATYAEAPSGMPFLITGSSNTLEISVRGGSAKEKLNIGIRDKITIA